MKPQRPFILFLLAILLTGCNQQTSYKPKKLDPHKTYDDVYLLMGQSNASGVAQYSYLEAKDPEAYAKYVTGVDNVLISYDCDDHIENNFVPTKFGFGAGADYFGPEIGMAEVLSKQEATSYIIKATYGGSRLMTQYVTVNGTKKKLYKRYISFIQKQLKTLIDEGKNPRVRGMFWMQGETDSYFTTPSPSKYGKAQQFLFEYIRHDLNDYIYDHFTFVDAYIYTRGTIWAHADAVNNCKLKFAERNEHCYCIKTNGEDENAITLYLSGESGEGDDPAHYCSTSMLLLGKTAGELIIK